MYCNVKLKSADCDDKKVVAQTVLFIYHDGSIAVRRYKITDSALVGDCFPA